QKPAAGTDYSTIYVGGKGEEFANHGFYYGISEKVDAGNRDHSDNALVFSDNIVTPAKSATEYGQILAGYVAHEAGHLLATEHAHDAPTDPARVAAVAYKPLTHIEAALDVRQDVVDDGMVTIDGRDYPVNPRIVEAIRDYPAYYYGGAGDDAFPDIVMAQQVL